jgi:hypothetical protein
LEYQLKVNKLLSSLGVVFATMFIQVAFAECNTVGMMGGCVPAAGMVDVPSHMKSQIVNKVTQQKATTLAAKVNATTASKKAGNTNIAIANATQTVQK